MSIKDLFKKKNKPVFLEDQIEAGVTSYDEEIKQRAVSFYELCARNMKDFKEQAQYIAETQANAYLTDREMRRLLDNNCSLPESFLETYLLHDNGTVPMDQHEMSYRQGFDAAAAYLLAEIEHLMNVFGGGFSAEKLAEICVTNEAIRKTFAKEGNVRYTRVFKRDAHITPPTKEDVIKYVDIIKEVTKCINSNKPYYNEQSFRIDIDGNPLEPWSSYPSCDKDLIEQVRQLDKKGVKSLFEKMNDGDIDEETAFSIYAKEVIDNAELLYKCTKEMKEADGVALYPALLRDHLLTDTMPGQKNLESCYGDRYSPQEFLSKVVSLCSSDKQADMVKKYMEYSLYIHTNRGSYKEKAALFDKNGWLILPSGEKV
ncbi:MAG: hypothetical protein K6G10_04020 [Butyrivibrio sp.]|nr:hypothetical protein [Butyrivibrio sp.]